METPEGFTLVPGLNHDEGLQEQLNLAVAKLAEQGSLPKDVADYLEAEGIQGLCGKPEYCVVADFLTSIIDLPQGAVVSVGGSGAHIARDGQILAHKNFPVHITNMIADFDREQLPQLEGIPVHAIRDED